MHLSANALPAKFRGGKPDRVKEAASTLAAFCADRRCGAEAPRPHSLFNARRSDFRSGFIWPQLNQAADGYCGPPLRGRHRFWEWESSPTFGRQKDESKCGLLITKFACRCANFFGRHINLSRNRAAQPLNIWNYPRLKPGQSASKRQMTFVLTDLLNLSKTPKDDTITYSIAKLIVLEVYKISKPETATGDQNFSRLWAIFSIFGKLRLNETEKRRTVFKLNIYRNDLWLDAPTHPDFDSDSPLTFMNWLSLIGRTRPRKYGLPYRGFDYAGDRRGKRQRSDYAISFLCDEMKEISKHFPPVLDLIGNTSLTMGRKEGVVTLFWWGVYEHFSGTDDAPNPIGIDLAKTPA